MQRSSPPAIVGPLQSPANPFARLINQSLAHGFYIKVSKARASFTAARQWTGRPLPQRVISIVLYSAERQLGDEHWTIEITR